MGYSYYKLVSEWFDQKKKISDLAWSQISFGSDDQYTQKSSRKQCYSQRVTFCLS